MRMAREDAAVAILNDAGARQHHNRHGEWVIEVPAQNDRPAVRWAIQDLAKTSGLEPHVVLVRKSA